MKDLYNFIRDVPDFPKEGINFKDISPLLASADAFNKAVDAMATPYRQQGVKKVVGIESRGFIFGIAISTLLNCGFVPVRKPGKLPYKTIRKEYALEYGTDTVEMHIDAVNPGERVLVVDDVLATGGTMQATCELLRETKADIVGLCFLMELSFLSGRERLTGSPISTVLTY
ncbi:MAG: adenine phosphoribosyltransferase [Candidatus Latescibacterota bacterium]|jgi:adenine phosphoribosyltransferase|tara:strand:- start:563 stop:1078 length:516 start_codon:yes stop_codon:yes gene_type:complete